MPTDVYQAEAPQLILNAAAADGTVNGSRQTANGSHHYLRVADTADGGPVEVDLDTTLSHPGSVRINVKGAFIVDNEGSSTPSSTTSSNGRGSPSHGHDTKDIRLPNHTAVVSHIAIDVGRPHVLSPRSPVFPFRPRGDDVMHTPT
jgi:type II pantothenate kinase